MWQPPDTQRRTAVIKSVLEFLQAFGRMGEDLQLSPEEVSLLMAVHLGEIENRLMDISTLSAITCLKFSTTHRLLKQLRERGLIVAERDGKRLLHRLSPDPVESPTVTRSYRDIERAIQTAARELSNLDN